MRLKETWSAIGFHFLETLRGKALHRSRADEYRTGNVAYGEVAADDTYRPRSGAGESGKDFWRLDNGRKQKRYGHQLGMVVNTRDNAKRGTIYATFQGARIALPGLVYLNQYKPKTKKYCSARRGATAEPAR